MRDSVLSARYSSICNVLHLWYISLIPTYRVHRLYDKHNMVSNPELTWVRVNECGVTGNSVAWKFCLGDNSVALF